jgi:hypothetical protein
MARFIKVLTVIDDDDSGVWVNADHVVAVVEVGNSVLVVTPTGTYRSHSQDAIDILSEMDLIVDEYRGFAVPGLEKVFLGDRVRRGLV